MKKIWEWLQSIFVGRYESPYSTSALTQRQIDANDYEDIVSVDNLGVETYLNNYRHKYLIMIEPELSHHCDMCLMFPNHPKPKSKTMFLRQYHGKTRQLQKELNRRLKECPAAQMTFCVACANRVYRFENIGGTVYLLWVSKIQQESRNSVEQEIITDVPVVIEMDGRGKHRSCFLFPTDRMEQGRQLQSLCISDCTFLEPHGETLFCMETDPRQEEDVHIHTMSSTQADEMASTLLSSLAFSKEMETVPYPSDDD